MRYASAKKIPAVVKFGSDCLIGVVGTFFIDSGADVSLIKESVLRYSEYVNQRVQIRIVGITQKESLMKGSLNIDLHNLTYLFQVVDDNFLTDTDALLG